MRLGIGLFLLAAWSGCSQGQASPQAVACMARIESEVLKHAPEVRSAQLAEGLHAHVEHLQYLVEESLAARAQMLSVREALRIRGLKEEPVSSRELKTLKEGGVAYLDLRKKLYEAAQFYECLIDIDEKDILALKVDPALRRTGVMTSLGAALTLYDNYLLSVMLFVEDTHIRRLMDDPDSGFGVEAGQLSEVTRAALSEEKRSRLRKGIEFYESMGGDSQDDDNAYLEMLISQSPSYNYVKKANTLKVSAQRVRHFERMSRDFIAQKKSDSMDTISKVFGNTMGMVESRKGKLYGDKKAHAHLQGLLRPMDILLEKTPFRLTDKFIPGHFGHVAIWIGTETDLREMGLWEHPLVKKHRKEIRGGHVIVEALREGVLLSTLEHFMNVDDVAVLRPVAIKGDPKAMQEALFMALRQVGKAYDFNFDVETTDKIVCSELAYAAFPTLSWPTDRTLGRDTISPDQVARKGLGGTPFRLMAFYHDGALLPEGRGLTLYTQKVQPQP